MCFTEGMSQVTVSQAPDLSHAGGLFQLLRDGLPRTRADLAKSTGLSRPTVAQRIDQLLGLGLITPVSDAVSTGGRPSSQFAFNPRARVVVAADFGASHARLAVTDLTGTVLAELGEEREISDGPNSAIEWLTTSALRLLDEADRSVVDVVGVGIGLPGPVEFSTGRPINPPIMPGWDRFDLPGALKETFSAPVLVDNDVNIMALGEHATSYPNVEHLVFVKVATGIGAGIISGGQLHRGAQGSAGDLGHVAAPHGEGIICRCGNEGCLEAVASGPAIVARLAEQGIHVTDSRALLELSRSGSPEAVAALRQAGREIGAVLASIVSLLNPSVIAIGGLLAQSNDGLLAGIREVVYGRSLPLATGELQIVAARTGDHAGVIGAATMVIQHVLSADEVERHLASWAS